MIVLAVVDAHRPAIAAAPGEVLGHAIRNRRQQLRDMQRRVGIVADAQQQHLAVVIAHRPTGLSGVCGGSGSAVFTIASAFGPMAAQAKRDRNARCRADARRSRR